MGINLAAVTYWSTEFPFINNFLTASQWITHSDTTFDTKEEQYANLDVNGWPITLTSVSESSRQQYNSLGSSSFSAASIRQTASTLAADISSYTRAGGRSRTGSMQPWCVARPGET
jgi:hypothetical protein